MTFDILPLAEPCGAVVRGWDPSSELTATELDTVKRAIRQHLVLIFRGHRSPTDDQFVQFARSWGHVVSAGDYYRGSVDESVPDELQYISNIRGKDKRPIGVAGAGELDWHTDYCHRPRVGKETFLAAEILPASGGGDTYFCDMYSALESLAPDLREGLEGMTACHDRSRIVSEHQGYVPADQHSSVHPVAFAHPESGRRSLYVNPRLTSHIVELAQDESDRVLASLFDAAITRDSVYRHRWEVGDLVVFDTIGTMHRRDAFDQTENRLMRQISTVT